MTDFGFSEISNPSSKIFKNPQTGLLYTPMRIDEQKSRGIPSEESREARVPKRMGYPLTSVVTLTLTLTLTNKMVRNYAHFKTCGFELGKDI
jgi:hypothetical protein